MSRVFPDLLQCSAFYQVDLNFSAISAFCDESGPFLCSFVILIASSFLIFLSAMRIYANDLFLLSRILCLSLGAR